MNTFRLVLLSVLFLGAAPVVAMNGAVWDDEQIFAETLNHMDQQKREDEQKQKEAAALKEQRNKESKEYMAAYCPEIVEKQKANKRNKAVKLNNANPAQCVFEEDNGLSLLGLHSDSNKVVSFYKRPTVMVPLLAVAGALAAAITGAVYKCVSYMQDSEFAAKSRLERIKLGVKRDFAKIKTVFSKKAPAYKKVS